MIENATQTLSGVGRWERRHWFGLVLMTGLLAINVWGFAYFAAPRPVQVRHSLHEFLSPTGVLGQTLGILAFLMFAFLWVYPLRKRLRFLRRMGVLSRWLDVHIVVGLTLPIVGATHAAWQFKGLIGLGYGAMLIVSLSGIVGRYLYRHIPRNRSGVELSLAEANAQRLERISEIAEVAGKPPEAIQELLERELPRRPQGRSNYLKTVIDLLAGDFLRWRTCRRLEHALQQDTGKKIGRPELKRIMKHAREEVSLTQQLRMLDATQAVFKFWHVAHMPFAVTAFAAVLIHVVVSVVLGVTWFW